MKESNTSDELQISDLIQMGEEYFHFTFQNIHDTEKLSLDMPIQPNMEKALVDKHCLITKGIPQSGFRAPSYFGKVTRIKMIELDKSHSCLSMFIEGHQSPRNVGSKEVAIFCEPRDLDGLIYYEPVYIYY
ncbi:MAG: hypothetical protein NTX91_00185 [candidate division SR1 bacterium]|nr:hypothetical protein [candidate division SR1 bacterium]